MEEIATFLESSEKLQKMTLLSLKNETIDAIMGNHLTNWTMEISSEQISMQAMVFKRFISSEN